MNDNQDTTAMVWRSKEDGLVRFGINKVPVTDETFDTFVDAVIALKKFYEVEE